MLERINKKEMEIALEFFSMICVIKGFRLSLNPHQSSNKIWTLANEMRVKFRYFIVKIDRFNAQRYSKVNSKSFLTQIEVLSLF